MLLTFVLSMRLGPQAGAGPHCLDVPAGDYHTWQVLDVPLQLVLLCASVSSLTTQLTPPARLPLIVLYESALCGWLKCTHADSHC